MVCLPLEPDGSWVYLGFMGIYHVPLPAEYFSAFSFCLDCSLWGGLSVGWTFVVPLYCGGCSLWVGLDQWCVNTLFGGACICVLVSGGGSLLSGVL